MEWIEHDQTILEYIKLNITIVRCQARPSATMFILAYAQHMRLRGRRKGEGDDESCIEGKDGREGKGGIL